MRFFILVFATILTFSAYSIPGDNCSTAILVSSNGCSSNTAYNNTGISGTLTNPSCFSTGTNNGMWFEFLAGSQSVNISVVGSSLAKAQIALLSSSSNNCSVSSFLEIACNSSTTNTSTVSYSQLNIGDTYFIYVDGTNNSTGTFKLCVNAINSPQNDQPCNAINLSADNFCSNVNAYSNIGATTENIMLSAVPACFGSGNEINSVYFKYTAIGSSNTIRINGSAMGLVRPQIAILTFDASCSGSTYSLLGCQQSLATSNEVSLSINNLIPGTEYIILVDGYNSNTGNFQICINSFAPVATVVNDECINAINLCPDNVYYTSTKNATPNVVNEPRQNGIYDEWNCNGVVDNSVWYKFTTKNILEPISFSITAACNGGKLQFEVFRRMDGQSPCSPNNVSANTTWQRINCVESSTATSTHVLSIPTSNLIANTDYYVIVDNHPGFFCDFNFSISGNKGADAGPDVTICKTGNPVQLGGEDPVGGTWSGPGVTSTGVLDPNLLSVGSQSVYYNQGGCSATKNVTIATVDVSISDDVEICLGTSTDILGSIIVFPSNSTFTYNWTPLGTISNANSLNPTVNPLVNTTYTLTAQDQNGCQDSDNINVLIKSNTNITLTVDDQNICGQTATVEAVVSPVGAYNYSWNVPAGFPNPGNVSSFNTTVPGDYTATIVPNNNVCNFDFEDYVIASAWALLNENLVPCWNTTAGDNLIEVWRTGAVPAYSGNQFVEINANIASTLHQDNLIFTAGTELEISFAHRGRSGTDVMRVLIGPVGGPYVVLGVYSTNNVAWAYYSSSYTVPANGTYSLRFESVSSTGGVSFGNFLDAVSIKLNDCPVAPQTGTISFIPDPTASISGSTSICSGLSSTINFVGTANSLVTYKVNNGVDVQITLDASGNASISTGNLSVNTVYSLVSVSKSGCVKAIVGSATISILAKPTVLSFTGGGNYCTGSAVSNVEVSLTGTPNWIISYTLNGAAQTRTGSSSPVSLGNGAGSYVLTGISDVNCSNSASGTQNIVINQTPLVDSPADVTSCDSYTLPNLTNGNYFTLSGGNGTQLASGTNITNSQTIFVYNETGTNPNCFSESSFSVTINQTPLVDAPANVTSCDSYTLPSLTNGNYFTLSGGNGTQLAAGTNITSSQTIFVYNETGTNPNCFSENSFTVTINQTPLVDSRANVTICDSYTLPNLTNGNYFTLSGGNGSQLASGTNITTSQTIFVYNETGTNPNCFSESSFTVTINQTPLVDSPANVTSCDSYILPNLTNGNYFTLSGGNGTQLIAGTTITSSQTIFVYNENVTNPNCFSENSFVVTINQTPLVDSPANVTICDSYILPNLTNGNYFTLSGGNGSQLLAGTSITSSQTIFVYNETATNPNCFSESSFTVTINQTPLVDSPANITSCDSYTLPNLTNGNYFTLSGGNGTQLASGTNITSSQTIYVYNETATNPNCFSENSFSVTINQTPLVDSPANVTICDSYTLPNLTNGNYFTLSGGNGSQLAAGTTITSSQTIFVYNENVTNPNCFSESSFVVTINQTPLVDSPANVTICDSYILPNLTNGNYFTLSGGNGTQLSSGTNITSSQTIFVYNETGTNPNCFSESSFTVTINQTPLVDSPANVTSCDSYILPSLTNGNYFTLSGGNGTQLSSGTNITSSQTIFVYNETGTNPNCFSENSFTVTINQTPLVDSPANVTSCDSYVLPNLINGNYYTLSGGNGLQLNAGTNITTSQTIFVYNETATNPNCFSESSFTVTINQTPLVDSPANITSCDSYVLPNLTNGNYYTLSGGNGSQLAAGTSITTSQTIFVYNETATNPNCFSENSFSVTINQTPLVDSPANVTICDSYTLPNLTNGNYFTLSGGNGSQLVAGTSITSSQTIFVYNETGTNPNCFSESSFVVTINQTPLVDSPVNVSSCDSYVLPNLINGNYFTLSGGNGTQLAAGTNITSSQTIFVYNETGTNPNCFSENSFVVTINQTPLADSPANVTICDSYVLPNLTNGNYFTLSGGNGLQLSAGTTITSSQTIFVYNETATNPNCFSENSFTVTINQTPLVDSPANVTSCDSYILPNLTNGNYFTLSGGNGTQLAAGTNITTSQTIFVYNETGTNPNCFSENSFTITINYSPIADFDFKKAELDLIDPKMELINNTSNGLNFIWDFGDQVNSIEENPIHIYEEAKNYVIMLLAISAEGCRDSIYKNISVIEPLIYYIPNSFSPNGDQHNNTFFPVFTSGYNPFDYHLSIFNRWGERIFESFDPQVGWDGTYKELGLVESDTYVWKIDFGLTINGEKKSIVGTVSVIN